MMMEIFLINRRLLPHSFLQHKILYYMNIYHNLFEQSSNFKVFGLLLLQQCCNEQSHAGHFTYKSIGKLPRNVITGS